MMAILMCLDTQGHLGEVHCHLGAFGTFRNAREASGAQRCELKQLYETISCMRPFHQRVTDNGFNKMGLENRTTPEQHT